ncbi:MAG: hypothetical protein E3J76_01245 [Candidatus Aminicenantes bacterium]|nr:MAG: hypothetical protein E3J76_01245 [Candidatus Aminicenantes bacterium]
MTLNKFTKACINLMLILLIALLVKFLIIIPRDVYAKSGVEYKVSSTEEEFENLAKDVGRSKLGTEWWEKMTPNGKWTYMFNWNAEKGWKFHSFIAFDDELFLIFER